MYFSCYKQNNCYIVLVMSEVWGVIHSYLNNLNMRD